MKIFPVIWDKNAKESLRDIYLYIKEESPYSAKKVRLEILKITASLSKMPERFSTEKYLSKKGKEYHSVTKWNYKIIYRIANNEVRILAIIHTRRNTKVIENIY